VTDAPPPNQLSRGELYRRIWETPLIRVAAEHGVTNFLLAALCQRHDIPTPPAGYWSKIAHGKPTNRPPLPGDPDQLLIVSGLQKPGFRASKPISRVERRAQSAALTPADRPLTPVPAHPKLNKTFTRLRTQKGDGLRHVTGPGCFTVVVSDAVLDRAERALSLLVAEVEQRGWSVRTGEKRLEFVVDGETIGCELTELTDRVPHRPTDKELAAKAAYAARLEAAKRTGAYVSTWDAPKIADWDRVPNGKLSLTLDEAVGYAGIRRTFSDRKTQQVETLIDCVTDAFEGYAVAVKARRVERERQRVIAEEQQRQREARQRRQDLETKRVEFLDRLLARAERISAIRSFQARLAQDTTLASVAQFHGWISDYVERLEAEVSAERIAEKIALTDLMNDDAVIASWIDVETGGYRRS
jgi:hypothetical protein